MNVINTESMIIFIVILVNVGIMTFVVVGACVTFMVMVIILINKE